MRTRTRRVGRALVQRAAGAVDAADRAVTRAWRGVTTPEERMTQLYPEAPPQGPPASPPANPAPAGPPTFAHADTAVPYEIALNAIRELSR
jgi:hypothetical protein